MATKYLRGLQYLTGTNGKDIPIFMKVCYEFWGYCINGTSSLTTPGGMPTTPTSGPAGFFEGASVLATGNDGVTSDLGVNFTSMSANFVQSMVNKHITIWSHTDPDSTDNSIYRIAAVISPTQLILYPFSGGTKDISTLKNNLTSRSALNYRVIDLIAASQLSVANGNYFVGTLSGASTVNTGQAAAQFQFFLRGSANNFGNFGMVVNPAGTWTGSTFSSTSIAERTNNNSINAFGTSSQVNGFITLVGDKDFFFGHIKSSNTGVSNLSTLFGMYFMITVPQRLYTQAQDPNPIAVLVGANNLLCTSVTDSISTNFGMLSANGSTTVGCQLLTKNFAGDGVNSPTYTIGPSMNPFLTTQPRISRAVYGEALISCTTASHFTLARGKMRNLGFTSNIFPQFHVFGDNGEFIHMGNGLLWPWDGSSLPYSLLPMGT